MSKALAETPVDLSEMIEHLVTEDDEPVDNFFSAKEQRLLANSLYASWTPPPSKDHPKKRRRFLADVNVGIFFALHQPPLVPDFFLSLDVEPHRDWHRKEHRSYFVWEFGKVPEVVIEVVSNRKGGELTAKLRDYAQMGVNYYVVHDPERQLSKDALRVYELGFGKRYRLREDKRLPDLGLSLTLWRGMFEGKEEEWLRWMDAKGRLIPTGEERAASAEKRATNAEKRASSAEKRAASAEKRASDAEAEIERLRAELARRTRAKKRASGNRG
ncbi:MAG: Uma2 family endonuclease [Acidobacteriota bacterium]